MWLKDRIKETVRFWLRLGSIRFIGQGLGIGNVTTGQRMVTKVLSLSRLTSVRRYRGYGGRCVLMVLTVLVLASCSIDGENSSAVDVADSPTPEPTTTPANASSQLGQRLPIEAYVWLGDRRLELEVARTPQQQAMGLMYREELPDDRGMLFPFNPPRPVSFWMKNVRIHLDMIFLLEGEVVGLAEDVPPCETVAARCPTYGPRDDVLVDAVIELRGGRAAELGIEVGDRLEVVRDES